MMNEPVSSIMTTELITMDPEDTMDKVLDVFLKKRIHHLPITHNEKLVGLITTDDLFKLNKPFESYPTILVKDVMTRKIARLEPDAKVGTAAQIFLKNWFHALPIVNGDDILVGLVTSFDVLKYNFKRSYPNERWDWLR